MMCTTVLHGGVCHRTSTPHKSGNKMKEKKKKFSKNDSGVFTINVKIKFRKITIIYVTRHSLKK